MAQYQTLNKVTRDFKAAAESHPQLNTVLNAAPVEWLNNGDIRYPACGFVYNSSSKQGTLVTYNFTCWVLDMMLKEGDNKEELYSDTVQICWDLVAFLDDEYERRYQLVDAITVQGLAFAQGDNLSGSTFDFSIQMPMPSACLVPVRSDGGDFLITEDGRVIYTQDGRPIAIESGSNTLIYAETGEPLLTEDGQNLILQ
jgi:hypothetical protein